MCLVLATPALVAQDLRVRLIDQAGVGIADAVVEVVLPEVLAAPYQDASSAAVDQVDKEFVPTVTSIVAGSRVSFPNNDDILHHVYSFSPANTFDIPLYGRDAQSLYVQQFPEPGVVEIGCNIHDWMLAYIYVAQTSKVATSDDEGRALITGLPEGTFPVRIWHARLPRDTDVVMSSVQIDGAGAELTVTLMLDRDRRIRRAPSASRKRYR